MIIGGQAVLLHGLPRMTKAIDRAKPVLLEREAVMFAFVEDVIIHKEIESVPERAGLSKAFEDLLAAVKMNS